MIYHHRRGLHLSCNSLGKFPGRKERESQPEMVIPARQPLVCKDGQMMMCVVFHILVMETSYYHRSRAFTRRRRQKAAALAK